MTQTIYAGIDAGGTAFKCIVGTGPGHILAEKTVPVTLPKQTLAECLTFFESVAADHGKPQSIGLASFGPVDLDRGSPNYGYITSTPKPHWHDTDIVGYFAEALGLPVAFDTDVNGALLAEQWWGAARGLHSAVYVTIGTGIGAGVMIDGRLVHGAMHAEAGHMLIPKHVDDGFHGVCPYHGACLEGLASGPAIAERWLKNPQKLAEDHPAWQLEAHYLAAMCVNLALVYSPQKIILGGGVMQQPVLLKHVRQSYLAQMNSYLGDQTGGIEEFIQTAVLGSKAGALGALAMAQNLQDAAP